VFEGIKKVKPLSTEIETAEVKSKSKYAEFKKSVGKE